VTQPFSDRRDTRSGNNGANDDEDAHDGNKPHRLHPDCPCWDHDGQDYGTNNEPVDVHPPGEQATQHYGPTTHIKALSPKVATSTTTVAVVLAAALFAVFVYAASKLRPSVAPDQA